jgi:ribosomal protein S18 acetylase RimI-like enzyme
MTRAHADADRPSVRADVGIVRREYDHPDAVDLVNALYDDQVARYGYADPAGADPRLYRPPHGVFVVAYSAGQPVACGGYRAFDVRTGCAEIKKMFVRPEWRGRGIGRDILCQLEDHAAASGFQSVILETGVRNTAALALYAAMGYRPRSRFAVAYRDPAVNRAFSKLLTVSDDGPTQRGDGFRVPG